jgi:hypothetical protein
MFSLFKKPSVHDPVEKQHEEIIDTVTALLSDIIGAKFLNGQPEPNKALQPTYLSLLRYGKSAVEHGR